MSKEYYLHLYIGCACVLTKSDGSFDTPAVGTHLTLNATLYMRCFEPSGSTLEVKLLLRPLSDTTEEEEKEVCKYTRDANALRLVHTAVGNEFVNPKVVVWLLSKHFDLFGLIESGLAIDKTKKL